MITIIFEDSVDFYFARQRVLEKLDEVRGSTLLPQGVVPRLAADATALGQVFWYTVEAGPSRPVDPARLWALNKYTVVPQLNSAQGVSEVATLRGAPPQCLREGRQRGRRRGRADALRREPAGRHPAGQGEDPGASAGPARRRPHRAGLRPDPAHPRGRPHPHDRHVARDRHRQRGGLP